MGLLETVEFKYPKELVYEYGAKAGLLIYVKEHLPQIPQMPMVVSKIGEPAKDFLARADQAGIPWPRMYRSSAVVELAGHEGDFPSYAVDAFKGEDKISRYFIQDGDYESLENDNEFNNRLEKLVEEIAGSPKSVDSNYPLAPEINVIATEYARCPYAGVLIKHPNRQDYYLTTITDTKDVRDRLTLTYHPRRGFSEFGVAWRRLIGLTEDLEAELETVIGWHDTIAKLPEMDPNWVYLLEFGLMPTQLFQVHYFKPIQMADFRFDVRRGGPKEPIIVGVTGQEGDNYELVFTTTGIRQTNLPTLLRTDVRWLKGAEVASPGYLLSDCGGILAHKDIKALRQSKLALLYPEDPPRGLKDGMVINVVSDGIDVKLTDKLTGEEIS